MLRRRIAAFFGDRARDDLLLLHFSCHGLKDDSGQLYFAAPTPRSATWTRPRSPPSSSAAQMARSRSSSVLMLLDCCYSGAIARGLRFRAGDSVDVNDHLGGTRPRDHHRLERDGVRVRGRRADRRGPAVRVHQPRSSRRCETGEADRDQDRWISVRELYDYVCDEVREVTPHQRPNMLSHLEGELYVARSRYVAPVALPPELLDALANPLASVRAGAVAALAELLRGRTARCPPSRARAARARRGRRRQPPRDRRRPSGPGRHGRRAPVDAAARRGGDAAGARRCCTRTPARPRRRRWSRGTHAPPDAAPPPVAPAERPAARRAGRRGAGAAPADDAEPAPPRRARRPERLVWRRPAGRCSRRAGSCTGRGSEQLACLLGDRGDSVGTSSS